MEVWRKELYHHGVKGQRWGVRRYQNPDGSLTSAGKKRIEKEYRKYAEKSGRRLGKYINSKVADKTVSTADEAMLADKAFTKKIASKYKPGSLITIETLRSEYGSKWDNIAAETFNKDIREYNKTDKNLQKARSLCKQYEMTKWSEIAMQDTAMLNENADYYRLLKGM